MKPDICLRQVVVIMCLAVLQRRLWRKELEDGDEIGQIFTQVVITQLDEAGQFIVGRCPSQVGVAVAEKGINAKRFAVLPVGDAFAG